MSAPPVTTLHQVRSLILDAAAQLKKIDVAASRNYVSALLLLKRSSDVFDEASARVYDRELARTGDDAEAVKAAGDPEEYTDVIFVPPESAWSGLLGVTSQVGNALHEALKGLEKYNSDLAGVLSHIDFNKSLGGTRFRDEALTSLIRRFDEVSLRDADLEFPGLVGDAYESLLATFAGFSGFKSGDMYTPASVVRLMVGLADPAPGHTVYDPCAGSGGLLIQARRHVADHHPDRAGYLALAGQELAAVQWVSARLNLVFHGIRDADVQMGDTLVDPRHVDGKRVERFDRVLANPEFSVKYDAAAVSAKAYGRFGYGMGVGSADLLFVQHMLASLAEGGLAVTVMPHGVLFRSKGEQVVRRAMLENDVIEAIVGLGPQLFSRTGIPTCLLLLRAPGGKPVERRGQILIVNADREYRPGRAGNHLDEEHLEKIRAVCREWREVEGFSRIVAVEDVLADDANLNIRRWVDNTPSPEPQDVSAHLYGGVPAAEVEPLRPIFGTFGLDVGDFFVSLDDGYLDVPSDGPAGAVARIEELAAPTVTELHDRCATWWAEEGDVLLEPMNQGSMAVKERLIVTFAQALGSQGVIGEFVLTGLVAQWWVDHMEEVQALAAGGPRRVVEGWAASVAALFPARRTQGGRRSSSHATDLRDAREHPLTVALLPGFRDVLREADEAFVALDAHLRSLKAAQEEHTEAGEETSPAQSPEYERLEGERKAALKVLEQLERELPAKFAEAVADISEQDARKIVLTVMGEDLVARYDSRVMDALRTVIDRYRSLTVKYEVSLERLEVDRDAATDRVRGLLSELAYPRRKSRGMPERSAPE
ncbi:class I SAM-dependent DNA methyltransferase [Actinomadura sp. BRA 177]|uniref:class I SAM-dependent DNA methyltransferase n=1 Tax=Actinomadura sp. BRA 177 TaxID=2745202 RepID=UPI001594FBF9|nr:class I SAM-dependent DNA methyltransferase [Actinomadura sp. BRA 177]NVI86043.1 SAM-dependent DNA methyltransferase [Actinomadura sp. BRA 177]